jgi:hypothetical protein
VPVCKLRLFPAHHTAALIEYELAVPAGTYLHTQSWLPWSYLFVGIPQIHNLAQNNLFGAYRVFLVSVRHLLFGRWTRTVDKAPPATSVSRRAR